MNYCEMGRNSKEVYNKLSLVLTVKKINTLYINRVHETGLEWPPIMKVNVKHRFWFSLASQGLYIEKKCLVSGCIMQFPSVLEESLTNISLYRLHNYYFELTVNETMLQWYTIYGRQTYTKISSAIFCS